MLKSWKSLLVVSAGAIVVAGSVTPAFAAAAKAGGKCTAAQVGKTTTAGSTTLSCKKSGKAGVWVRVTATTVAETVPPATTATTVASTIAAAATNVENGPGVTATTIKIGFMEAAFRTPAGFLPSSTGNAKDQIAALVDVINATGGIGGRKVTPVIRPFDLSQSNDKQAETLCNAFADDDKVFAVVSQSVIVSSTARECFAKKKVVYLEAAGAFPLDTKTLERMKPYGYVVNLPAIDRIGTSYAKMLGEQKFFGADPKAAKVGILSMNDPAYQRAVDDLKAELKKTSGVEAIDTVFFDTTSQDTVSRDSAAASTRFAAKNIDHVISLVSGGNVMQFLWTSFDNGYKPRMSLTSTDNLAVVQNGALFRLRAVDKSMFKDAIAIGFNPITDTEDTQLIFPQPGPEKRCIDIYTNRQLITGFERRYLSRYAQAYCDGLFFLQTVVKRMPGGLNAAALQAEVEKLGSKGYDASVGWLTKFGPGRYDGGNGYRVLKFSDDCRKPINGCFEYSSGVKELE